MTELPDWARAHGPPLFAAQIKTEPNDFIVTENLEIETSGDGEHDWLWVSKTGANTAWVADQLARHASVHSRDVGFAGLKDRHAVTRQWFSVRRASTKGTDWDKADIEGVEIVDVKRHSRKLKRGAHRGNSFRIALRGDLPNAIEIDERLALIAEQGAPNYFGEQRFGRNGANIDLGRSVVDGRKLSRTKRSIGLSALRSFAFNNDLSDRVEDDTWNRLVPGDTAKLDGTNSVFPVEAVDEELEARCKAMDIHPTAILPGIEAIGVKESRRATRMTVEELSWDIQPEVLWLEFILASGSFATSVLREIADY